MTGKNPWCEITTYPGPGVIVRVKGWDSRDPELSALGYYDDYERIWIEIGEGPDANILSSYPEEPTAYGPTHWKTCVHTRLRDKRSFIPKSAIETGMWDITLAPVVDGRVIHDQRIEALVPGATRDQAREAVLADHPGYCLTYITPYHAPAGS